MAEEIAKFMFATIEMTGKMVGVLVTFENETDFRH